MTNPENNNAPRSGQAGEASKRSNVQAGFCYPNLNTVKGRVLGALLRGERVTHLDCWRRFGSSRLAHHVYSLRKDDAWPVRVIEQEVTTTDGGRKAVIGLYDLDAETIEQAGERGATYAAEAARVEVERRVR